MNDQSHYFVVRRKVFSGSVETGGWEVQKQFDEFTENLTPTSVRQDGSITWVQSSTDLSTILTAIVEYTVQVQGNDPRGQYT